MRSALVPAQITSIEDKITANFSLRQILIFILVIFINLILYIFLPTSLKLTLYKIILMIMFSSFLSILALRIKDTLVIDYLILYFRFNLRPRIYLFSVKPLLSPSKDDFSYKKNTDKSQQSNKAVQDTDLSKKQSNIKKFPINQYTNFKIKKGALYVFKNEI